MAKQMVDKIIGLSKEESALIAVFKQLDESNKKFVSRAAKGQLEAQHRLSELMAEGLTLEEAHKAYSKELAKLLEERLNS